ncbi:MAG: phosphoribosylaminoimidazolesuccinocarboxamide synthase [Phycisphaeraceae bacterium]|nr:phosphoribosylaminoimidazolesuccinocarboxamide synthase [Phycisphaeraceae bacterium]MCW5754150.1 phosphoribosylaminoimidazolesuccinocarboxamide synthase [Phycisphaeraceae bacterium]
MTGAASSTQWGSSRSVFRTDLHLPGRREGKVRDVYALPPRADVSHGPPDPPRLLIIATDRISAFDVVMPTPIPAKGILLTRLARFWLSWIEKQGLCDTHLLDASLDQIPPSAFTGASITRDDLAGRTMITRQCRVIPIECVVRGYLDGSGLKDYRETGSICGVRLPPGLQRADRLPEPIFTPATKEEGGRHDQNITYDEACHRVGRDLMAVLRDRALAIYHAAAARALERGIIIADTKFEFGFPLDNTGEPSGEAILIDEALTPDSSRFWLSDRWQPGTAQQSFDKQFLRDYLQSLADAGAWNKTPPAPSLPAEIVEGTQARYVEACERLIDP